MGSATLAKIRIFRHLKIKLVGVPDPAEHTEADCSLEQIVQNTELVPITKREVLPTGEREAKECRLHTCERETRFLVWLT